jgi:hypothetical protein
MGCEVETHHSLVSVEGAGFQVESLGRQPISGEKCGDGQLGSTAVASCCFRCGETSRQSFGFGTIGAGSVPLSALLAGYRIDPFVDHGIPDVTLTRHVPFHECLLS